MHRPLRRADLTIESTESDRHSSWTLNYNRTVQMIGGLDAICSEVNLTTKWLITDYVSGTCIGGPVLCVCVQTITFERNNL